jgi:hypothetical protein
MKNQRKFLADLWILFCFLISGCNRQTALPPTPNLGIPEDEFNKRIQLMAPKGWNTYKIKDSVAINVDVVSNDQIAFQNNFGAVIFELEGQEWTEIPNLMKYPEGYEVLGPSKGDAFKQGTTVVSPILQDTKLPVTLRIVLIGNIYRNGQITDEQTAGYVDVELTP